jgi:AraC-like DNA-binding protein
MDLRSLTGSSMLIAPRSSRFSREATMHSASISGFETERFLSGGAAGSLIRLLQTAFREVDTDREAAKAVIAKASSLLQVQIERSAVVRPDSRTSGGLTAWQIQRVVAFVDEHLSDAVRVEDLRQVVNLSVTYFGRAFRRSFGEAPHAYLIRRRLEFARHLMLTSDITLSELALACGFSDQAHLCRHFRQSVGSSPAAWRREQREWKRIQD